MGVILEKSRVFKKFSGNPEKSVRVIETTGINQVAWGEV